MWWWWCVVGGPSVVVSLTHRKCVAANEREVDISIPRQPRPGLANKSQRQTQSPPHAPSRPVGSYVAPPGRCSDSLCNVERDDMDPVLSRRIFCHNSLEIFRGSTVPRAAGGYEYCSGTQLARRQETGPIPCQIAPAYAHMRGRVVWTCARVRPDAGLGSVKELVSVKA